MRQKDKIFLFVFTLFVILVIGQLLAKYSSVEVNMGILIIAFLVNYLTIYTLYYGNKLLLYEENSTSENIKVTDDLVSEFEDSIRIENMIGNMSDDEFYSFISTDRYGGDNADVGAILNLLEKIKSIPMYESKEKIIYKKLKEIRQ